MVSGINFSNYTVDQLKELKANGVNVPDNAITEAQAKEEAAAADAKKSDEANVSYTITDDASKTNEAKQEVETAKEYGANLKTILGNLISKCDTKNSEMAQLQSELDDFQAQATAVNNELTFIAGSVKAGVEETQGKVEDIQKDIAKKQTEAQEKQNAAEEIVNNAGEEGLTTDDQTKVDALSKEAESIGMTIGDLVSDINTIAAGSKAMKINGEAKAQALGTTLENIKSAMTDTSNKAINANEYADVTIEKGTEASNITSKKEAKAAGFTKKGFLGIGKKGNVKAANNMGNQAIAKGEQLGGSTVNIAKGVQNVANEFNIGFAKTSTIADLSKKEYVDTTAFAEAENTAQNAKGFRNRFKAGRALQAEANRVAEASKNKGKDQVKSNIKAGNTTLDDITKAKMSNFEKTNQA